MWHKLDFNYMGAQEASGCAQIIVVCGEQEKALPFLMLSYAFSADGYCRPQK